MTPTDFLAHLADDVDRLEALDLDADDDIPSCPGWSTATLVNHLGSVFLWHTAGLNADDDLPPFPEERAPSDPVAAQTWLVAAGREFLARAGELGPDDVRPSWMGPSPVSWFRRRIALETAVHRWDLENALGTPAAIPAELAASGIDEWLEFARSRPGLSLSGTVHLHGTDDVEGEWMIEPGPPLTWSAAHGKGDVALRGPLGVLYLALWGRVDLDHDDRLAHFGNRDVLASLIGS